jgi:hypothetical protein
MPILMRIACHTTLLLIAGLAVNIQIARTVSSSGPAEKRSVREVNDESLVRDLNPQEQAEIYKAIEKDLHASSNSEGTSVEEGRKIILGMDTDNIPAGKRGSDLLLVSGNDHSLCSPTGNCSVWLFVRDHKHLRLVLAGLAGGVEVQKHMTQGMHDLALRTHWSGSETHYTICRWTGSKYEAADCFVNNPNGKEGNCPF